MGLWSIKLTKGYPNWMLLFAWPLDPAVINIDQCVGYCTSTDPEANPALRTSPQGGPWKKRSTHELHTIKKQVVDTPQHGTPIFSPSYLLPALGPQISPAAIGNGRKYFFPFSPAVCVYAMPAGVNLKAEDPEFTNKPASLPFYSQWL